MDQMDRSSRGAEGGTETPLASRRAGAVGAAITPSSWWEFTLRCCGAKRVRGDRGRHAQADLRPRRTEGRARTLQRQYAHSVRVRMGTGIQLKDGLRLTYDWDTRGDDTRVVRRR
jgi:hypothetical protein